MSTPTEQAFPGDRDLGRRGPLVRRRTLDSLSAPVPRHAARRRRADRQRARHQRHPGRQRDRRVSARSSSARRLAIRVERRGARAGRSSARPASTTPVAAGCRWSARSARRGASRMAGDRQGRLGRARPSRLSRRHPFSAGSSARASRLPPATVEAEVLPHSPRGGPDDRQSPSRHQLSADQLDAPARPAGGAAGLPRRAARRLERLRHRARLGSAAREINASLQRGARAALHDVQVALWQLDEGDYGRCAVCGDALDPDQLRSVPQALRCASCREAER